MIPTKLHRLTYCPECLKKQQVIDRLQQEIVGLKAKPRTIIDVEPVRKEVIRYHLQQRDCGRSHRTFTARAPGVFPKGLFGNALLTHVAVEPYVHGVILGHLSQQLRVGTGSLWSALHGLAERFAAVPEHLIQDYRQAPVKHADETGWRTDGHNGYVWLFCTERISLFRFRQSRAAHVAQQVLGTTRFPGTLVVDRYNCVRWSSPAKSASARSPSREPAPGKPS